MRIKGEKKVIIKITAEKAALLNRFASKRDCVETDLRWNGSSTKRVANRKSASKRSRRIVVYLELNFFWSFAKSGFF